ncbi:hypothetical protein [Flavobacterium sp. Root420]|uniref:hypothetical protein n=1 Tax=Flavobacterium sp. Root420 TaxID=1736533 RepID=UPI000700ED5D|nr:hypothetical protein [Flavobacterium sp. Root420]KQW99281.1 hypothetical protein ASC72_09345 [Flavobacterium sp. Root420]
MLFQNITKYKIIPLLAFIFCSIPVLCYPQAQTYSPKIRLAIETYAFVKGQSSALETIARQFPALKPKILAAEKNSEISMARAERNIERFLQDELTGSEFAMLQQRIDSLLDEQLKNPIEKEKYALDFLNKISNRHRSITDTILSKSILSFVYHDNPQEEIIDGHITTFTTKGHSKADQTTLKVPIPKSWLAEEAQMRETVQQFTSYSGKGNEKILIVVYDLSDEQHEIVLNEKSIAQMIPPQSRLIRTDEVKIDGIPGMMIEVEQHLNYTANPMKVRMLQFMFTQNQKIYCLQGSIGPVGVSQNLDPQIKKYEPLFRLIASKSEID